MTRKIERTCRSPSYSQLCKARQRAEELYKSFVVSRSDGLRLAAFRRKVLHGLDHIHQKGNTMKVDGNLDVKRIKGKGEAAEDADEDTNSKTAAEAFDPCTHGQAGGVESLIQGNMHYAGIREKIQSPKTWETKPLSSSSLWRVSLPDRAAFSLSIFLRPNLSETSHFHPSRSSGYRWHCLSCDVFPLSLSDS